MNNSVYTAAINYVSLFQKANIKAVWSITDKSRFAVLHNTWRFGGAPVGRHLVSFGSINCKPVNRNSKIFQSFCLKVDYVYLLTIQLKLEIVPTISKIERRLFFFSSVAVGLFLEWAYNAAASTAPTLIRHWIAPPTSRPIIDSSNDCNKASVPVVCRCMDQSNWQIGLSGRYFPRNCPFPFGDRHACLTHCSSGQAHSLSQSASRSVQPFLYGSQTLCCTMRCQWVWKSPKLPPFPWDFVTLPKEDRYTAIGNVHKTR